MIRKLVWVGVLLIGWVPAIVIADDARCNPWDAKVVSVQGQVEAKRSAASDWLPATLNSTYCSGDSLRVGDNSRAAIALSNQTLLRLDQNSAITLTAIHTETPSLLELLSGFVHFISRVPQSLKVNTPFVNAAIEGTEFVVAVTDRDTSVTVFEGRVLVQNAAGEVRISRNETAQTLAGGAPQKILRATPRDAVQWALYYPPILSTTDPLAPAAELLYRGRIGEARQQLKQLPADQATSGSAKALEAIIAVVQNDAPRALQLATQAVQQSPDLAASHIALSYAQQAQFDLDAATQSASRATQVEANNALAYARLAELQLSRGRLNEALLSAQAAVQLDANQARAQTILGFTQLIRIDISNAVTTFEQAIVLDQADPLPRLGLGLAKIRRNQLSEGRREIEIAALLDPNNALIRSYLGKAYFEEKRAPLDAEQFTMAKELDPNDPTPWFYDAIRKQSENRPVEALEDLQQSIELNNNRAVYRSRLQLDQDQAARSVSSARIYSALGFEQQAQTQAAKSLAADPTNHSAHRFLSDIYASRPRHEIARSSELLQSQLLQPLSLTPLQPSLSETSLNTLSAQGPASATFNEYTPLFNRNGTRITNTLVVGNNDTFGDELVIAGLYNRIAYSLGQYSYSSDGFRDKADLEHDITNLFAQIQLSSKLDIQFEFRHRRTEQGDLRQDFNPNFVPRDQRTLDEDTNRFGLHYKVSPQSDFLVSYIKNERDAPFLRSPPPSSVRTTSSDQSDDTQVQYLWHGQSFNVVAGAGISEVMSSILTTLSRGPILIESGASPEINQHNYYIYNSYTFNTVLATLGVSYDAYDSVAPDREFNETNPKFGLIWDVTATARLRLASYQAFKRGLTANQTLEPTQLAGFNQFFDDVNGTKIHAKGVALDLKLTNRFDYGLEYFKRELQVPETQVGSRINIITNDQDQYKLVLNWDLSREWIFSTEYLYEKFTNKATNPTDLKTTSLPLKLYWFSPAGLFANLKANYVKQDTVFPARTSFSQRKENFTLVDIGLGYRLPKRRGVISVEANNLFDQQFIYQDYYLFSADPFNYHPRYLPTRSITGRITLNF